MPSSVIGALRVQLGLDSADFNRGMTEAEVRAYKAGEKIGRSLRGAADTALSLKGALAGVGTALAVDAFAGAAQRAFDYADSIQDLADRTGATTKTIQEFRYAAQLSGSSVESADAAIEKFARSQGLAQAGSATMVKLFASLGITSKDFDTALRQLMDGLAKLPTVQQRNAVALQVLGKSAGDLTNLLGQGSAGFDDLAKRANELGIVLKDDVIANAGGANDKLDTLKMILNAQFANAIVQNANAFVSLADGITRATKAALDFINAHPEAAGAIAGGVAGSRAGVIGAAIGAYGGYRAGGVLADNSSDVSQRITRAKAAQDAYRAAKAERDAHPLLARAYDGKVGVAAQEVIKQNALLAAAQKRLAASRSGGAAPVTGTLPTVAASGGGSGASRAATEAKAAEREAKRQAEEQRRNNQRFAADEFRAQNELQDAQADLTASAVERYQFERDRIRREKAFDVEAIRADEHLSDAQKAKLIALVESTAAAKTELAHRQEAEQANREQLEQAQARSDSESEILSAQSGLARTSKQRREIEFQILKLQFAQLRAYQQSIIDSDNPNVTAGQREEAGKRIQDLGKLENLATARVQQQNQGPLAGYLDSIPRSAAEVNEALENVAAGGIASIVDGLSEAVTGAKSLGDVFKDVASDIIRQLIRIGIQQAILGPLTKALFPNAPAVPIAGARAAGGPTIGGKNYLVGEQGPELFTPSTSGHIIPNDALIGDRGGPTVNQTIEFTGGVDLATKQEVVRMAQATKNATLEALRQRARRSFSGSPF